jgi:hypothetical protein
VCQRLYVGSRGVSEGGRLTKESSTDTEQWSDSKYKRGARGDWSWAAVECSGNQDVD